jgi:hypothetical protein
MKRTSLLVTSPVMFLNLIACDITGDVSQPAFLQEIFSVMDFWEKLYIILP